MRESKNSRWEFHSLDKQLHRSTSKQALSNYLVIVVVSATFEPFSEQTVGLIYDDERLKDDASIIHDCLLTPLLDGEEHAFRGRRQAWGLFQTGN
ncbi:hypothetical protein AVEN_76077-1 [Araneus ventricosus]|uniref:Uncharacterized protein n=1 Tax=Araneus ventricosus TaxID=182803 RepID=A0A4Y2NKG4_ARAVE|nr:hypothetical protein AVEN_76077-1 [Araneus ventricosus]